MIPDLASSYAAEWPRVVGATLRAFGSLELAEGCAQEAFVRAAERMAAGERIGNVGAWATTAARHLAIDALRRDEAFRGRLPLLAEEEPEAEDAAEARLSLLFVACDPVLSEEQQIALALRIVCGVPTADIADFFEVAEATVAARLTRAKKAIAASGATFALPEDAQHTARLGAVLTVIYGIYTLAHTAPSGPELVDADLVALALGLIEAVEQEFPSDAEVLGLHAVIVLGEARRPARLSPDGLPVTLADADRSAWGQQRIRAGLRLAALALPGGGRFALQAGIAGLHCSAPSWEETDWDAIATLYRGLLRVWPAPIVRLGSIVAASHRAGADLERLVVELHRLRDGAAPEFARRVWAAVADLEERSGHPELARNAFAGALAGERNRAIAGYFEAALVRVGPASGTAVSGTAASGTAADGPATAGSATEHADDRPARGR